VSRPAKRSQGNHDPSRGPWRAAADSRAGASDAVVGQRPSVGDVDWPRGAVAAALPVGTVEWAAVALPAIATAADAENDATATTVTVSEHNFGHNHPGSNHATPYTR
jgi:hypothetical protein